jgi:hypothetical protein
MRLIRLLACLVLVLPRVQWLNAETFPLQISPDHRYLEDAAGKPFFAQGDSPWSLISALTRVEVDRYLEDRRTKGFNALIVNLIEHKFRGPVNAYGEGPFVSQGDFETPNEKYFQQADWVLKRAAEKGFVVFLTPMYLGYKGTDEGWNQEAILNGDAKCREFGRYLGRRYRDYSNIVWMMGGDRNPGLAWETTDALARGISEAAPNAIFTAHADHESSTVQQYSAGGWLNINTTYTYAIVHELLLRDYNQRPTMPNVLIETTYENEHNASPVQLRRQAYWAIMCGATGQFFGNKPIWGFDKGWEIALNDRGSQDMATVAKFLGTIPWWTLVPDDKHEVIVRGIGEFNGMDYLAAALSHDRGTLVAYMPSARTFTVDCSKLGKAPLVSSWFNPRTGETTIGAPIKTTGKIDLSPPGDGDWIFVLKSSLPSGS